MYLTDEEKAMLDGNEGEAVKLAMEILVTAGESLGAQRLIPVSSAHIVLAMYKSIYDAGVEVCEKFAALGGKFKIPTTLDPCGMDTENWEEFKTPHEYASKQIRVMKAYKEMGAIPVWTCTPYFTGNLPRFGEHVAWTESSAVAFINSVLGARSNRETAVLDICAGLTGRVPEHGLHLDENRKGEVLIHLQLGNRALASWEYPVLGYYLGKTLGSQIGVVEGMKGHPSNDDLKAMMAAAAASGSLALIHIVGITPEAPTTKIAFGGRPISSELEVTEDILAKTREEMCTKDTGNIDLVAVGCPHYSIGEIERVVRLLHGRRIHPNTEFWVYTNKNTAVMAERMGFRQALKESGVRLVLETCMLISPIETWGFKTIMTDSGKCAYYAPMQCKADVIFGSIEECVESAVSGRLLREGGKRL
ncbi:predicted aconitase subunit 1 [Thermanaeromonas toyohensis ToBE]|uniref:Predicted aconitase subunit 1 n=1 Tax=Thermanaeromonas toyohensis ToBE TaxID=698762 RepID=A0A1W1VGN4_9FIRM|nr:aconitase X catalytic domain-containing protein [Thermanaeromonas toyohensis]SMB92241.1 predicted aconitase subunit 1 [Thermanaeromonas toyohensis ToBE]